MHRTQRRFLTSGCSCPRWPLRGRTPPACPPWRAEREGLLQQPRRFRIRLEDTRGLTGAGDLVHEIGVMFLVFMPVPYVDASSSAAFREKRKRMVVSAAGILVELFLGETAQRGVVVEHVEAAPEGGDDDVVLAPLQLEVGHLDGGQAAGQLHPALAVAGEVHRELGAQEEQRRPVAEAPLPVAAVVLPSESRASVRLRTSSPSPLISALPPALSAIGP